MNRDQLFALSWAPTGSGWGVGASQALQVADAQAFGAGAVLVSMVLTSVPLAVVAITNPVEAIGSSRAPLSSKDRVVDV